MAPVQSRRSRKLREATYIDGQQNSIMRELSAPNRDGTVPIMNFLENTTLFIEDTRRLYDRVAHLEKENAKYRRFQSKIILHLEEIRQILNNRSDLGPTFEKLVSFDALDEVESQLYTEESATSPSLENLPQDVLGESTLHDPSTALVSLEYSDYAFSLPKEPKELKTLYMTQLSAQDEMNAVLEGDLRKMEALTKEMKLRQNDGKNQLLKHNRKSGKNRAIVLTDPNRKEEVKPQKEYSLKKMSRGSKLRKVYEENIQLNRRMHSEMNELETIRQYLLQDDENDEGDENGVQIDSSSTV